ncbi:triose-phosphate isomerase [Bacteroidota bacterium]
MRNKIVAGNWKMNTTIHEGIRLVQEINELAGKILDNDVVIIVAPPFSHLSEISKELSQSISLAAQNCSSEPKGAYTGEVSASILKSIPCNAVIIGHSERRKYFAEKNTDLAKKVDLCICNELFPIFCCGEELADRESGNYFNIIKKQISEGLFHLSPEDFSTVVIAYEPVWAIGTGVTASPEQAQEMHSFIRDLVKEKYGEALANSTSILYGGSCKPENAKDIFCKPDVDGGLIGGAALKAKDFFDIINSF